MVNVWNVVKTVARNLGIIRKEIVAAATAAGSVVGIFEVTFPSISAAHIALFASITAATTGIATFLSNSKVVADIDAFSQQPMWKSRLRYLVKGSKA